MRCLSCNKRLTDKESTRKYVTDKVVYVDLCDHCFSYVEDDVLSTEPAIVMEEELEHIDTDLLIDGDSDASY